MRPLPSRYNQTTDASELIPEVLCVSWIDLRQAPPPDALADLDSYEQDRAARFAPADRRRYEAAHCGLRAAIRTFCGVTTRPIDFIRGPFGKPSLATELRCRLSLSYCDDLAVIALTRNLEIGIDIERVRPIEAVEELAACHFAAPEIDELITCEPGAARTHAFLRGWVRKEACVKAVGTGLTIPTNGFISGIGAEPRSVVLTLDEHEIMLVVGTLSVVPTGYIAAWAAVVPAQ